MNALEYLTQVRVNMELVTHLGSDNILYIGIRLRPWKQDTRHPTMVLGQGLTVNDALNDAARNHYNNLWRTLDYRERPWSMNLQEALGTESLPTLDFLDQPRLLETPRALQRNRDTRSLPITPLDVA